MNPTINFFCSDGVIGLNISSSLRFKLKVAPRTLYYWAHDYPLFLKKTRDKVKQREREFNFDHVTMNRVQNIESFYSLFFVLLLYLTKIIWAKTTTLI
jgi:hypothetical protein